ncbi:MAG: hypothetical protein DRI69_04170 [Bacteroidetes bacterium]|nr:MAG: hypothetical protein DRI69_04170 [Bacteroidota bacterium]
MNNKTVIVTGGSKGIGESCVRLFHEHDANVAIFDVDSEAGKKLSDDLGERCVFIQCDVADGASVRHAIAAVIGHFGSIDVLINNAGIVSYASVTESTEEDWDNTIGVNLKGPFLCSKYAVPVMLQTGKGVVINVSSVQAYITQERVAAYTTSKTALLGLTRSIAVDYAPNIRCVAVCPGTIDTPMLHEAIKLSSDPRTVLKECDDMHLTGKIGRSDDVAELIYYLASDKASFITGQAFRIDGGLGIVIGGSQRD